MKISYQLLKEHLSYGMEYHFKYNNEQYAISHGNGFPIIWYLSKFNDPNFLQIFNSSNELLDEAKINGKLLSEIWEDVINIV